MPNTFVRNVRHMYLILNWKLDLRNFNYKICFVNLKVVKYLISNIIFLINEFLTLFKWFENKYLFKIYIFK